MSYAGLLEQIDIFADLSKARLEQIAAICVERHYESGAVIFEENSRSDELYIILAGEVDIEVAPEPPAAGTAEAETITIARLRQGQSFGEMALVDEGLRSASARSVAADTRLLAIRRGDLLKLCRADFELGFILMRNMASDLAMKIRQTDLRMRQRLPG